MPVRLLSRRRIASRRCVENFRRSSYPVHSSTIHYYEIFVLIGKIYTVYIDQVHRVRNISLLSFVSFHILNNRPDHHPCLMKTDHGACRHSCDSRPFGASLFNTITACEVSQKNESADKERHGDDLPNNDEIIGSDSHRRLFPGKYFFRVRFEDGAQSCKALLIDALYCQRKRLSGPPRLDASAPLPTCPLESFRKSDPL